MINEDIQKRMDEINCLDKTITISTKAMMIGLQILLEASAISNFEYWKDKGAMNIDHEWVNLSAPYRDEHIRESDLGKIQEALNTLAENGLLEINEIFEFAEIKQKGKKEDGEDERPLC